MMNRELAAKQLEEAMSAVVAHTVSLPPEISDGIPDVRQEVLDALRQAIVEAVPYLHHPRMRGLVVEAICAFNRWEEAVTNTMAMASIHVSPHSPGGAT